MMKNIFLASLIGGLFFSSATQAQDRVVNLKTPNGLCLGVTGGNAANGAKFVTWNCDGSANQKFKLTGQNNVFKVQPVHANNKCLGIFGGSNQVVLWDCNNSADQNIRLENSSEPGYFTLKPQSADKCIGISGDNTNAGASLILWSCNGKPSQRFRF